MSNCLWSPWTYGVIPGFPVPHHSRLPCSSPSPGVCSNSSWLSQWCHPTISSSVIPFSSCLLSFPTLGSFPMSQLFERGFQSVGASASVLPMNIKGWFCLGLTCLISLLYKVFSTFFSIVFPWDWNENWSFLVLRPLLSFPTHGKVMTNLDSKLKSKDITLQTKVYIVKAKVFPVVMYRCESRSIKKTGCQRIEAFKSWCWRRLLSPLDHKEIKPVNPKGN